MAAINEFELIDRFFRRPSQSAVLGIGDDAALVQSTPGHEIALSVDMLVAGRHFFEDVDPELLDPVLLTFDAGRRTQKAKYFGELFPAEMDAVIRADGNDASPVPFAQVVKSANQLHEPARPKGQSIARRGLKAERKDGGSAGRWPAVR